MAVSTGAGPAVVSRGSGCRGLLIDHPDVGAERCIEDAAFAEWSPDGRRLAVVMTEEVMPRDQDAPPELSWELSVFDVQSGAETRVGSGAVTGSPTGSPSVAWNDEGTHFVVFTNPDL